MEQSLKWDTVLLFSLGNILEDKQPGANLLPPDCRGPASSYFIVSVFSAVGTVELLDSKWPLCPAGVGEEERKQGL